MIVREFYATRSDGVKLYKIYSDENKYIKQLPTNAIYDIAIDVENAPYTYLETDEVIKDNGATNN
jgi:hypothetical protein